MLMKLVDSKQANEIILDFFIIFFPTHISATRSGVGSGLSPHMSPEGDLPCGGGGGEFISIYDFEVQEIGFKSNDCMKESKSVKTSPSSLMLSSIAAIVSSLA